VCRGTRRCGRRGLEEIDDEDTDEGFEGVAEAGVDSDEVVGDGQQEEGPGEEVGGGDAAM
jgi:hypothetical protein